MRTVKLCGESSFDSHHVSREGHFSVADSERLQFTTRAREIHADQAYRRKSDADYSEHERHPVLLSERIEAPKERFDSQSHHLPSRYSTSAHSSDLHGPTDGRWQINQEQFIGADLEYDLASFDNPQRGAEQSSEAKYYADYNRASKDIAGSSRPETSYGKGHSERKRRLTGGAYSSSSVRNDFKDEYSGDSAYKRESRRDSVEFYRSSRPCSRGDNIPISKDQYFFDLREGRSSACQNDSRGNDKPRRSIVSPYSRHRNESSRRRKSFTGGNESHISHLGQSASCKEQHNSQFKYSSRISDGRTSPSRHTSRYSENNAKVSVSRVSSNSSRESENQSLRRQYSSRIIEEQGSYFRSQYLSSRGCDDHSLRNRSISGGSEEPKSQGCSSSRKCDDRCSPPSSRECDKRSLRKISHSEGSGKFTPRNLYSSLQGGDHSEIPSPTAALSIGEMTCIASSIIVADEEENKSEDAMSAGSPSLSPVRQESHIRFIKRRRVSSSSSSSRSGEVKTIIKLEKDFENDIYTPPSPRQKFGQEGTLGNHSITVPDPGRDSLSQTSGLEFRIITRRDTSTESNPDPDVISPVRGKKRLEKSRSPSRERLKNKKHKGKKKKRKKEKKKKEHKRKRCSSSSRSRDRSRSHEGQGKVRGAHLVYDRHAISKRFPNGRSQERILDRRSRGKEKKRKSLDRRLSPFYSRSPSYRRGKSSTRRQEPSKQIDLRQVLEARRKSDEYRARKGDVSPRDRSEVAKETAQLPKEGQESTDKNVKHPCKTTSDEAKPSSLTKRKKLKAKDGSKFNESIEEGELICESDLESKSDSSISNNSGTSQASKKSDHKMNNAHFGNKIIKQEKEIKKENTELIRCATLTAVTKCLIKGEKANSGDSAERPDVKPKFNPSKDAVLRVLSGNWSAPTLVVNLGESSDDQEDPPFDDGADTSVPCAPVPSTSVPSTSTPQQPHLSSSTSTSYGKTGLFTPVSRITDSVSDRVLPDPPRVNPSAAASQLSPEPAPPSSSTCSSAAAVDETLKSCDTYLSKSRNTKPPKSGFSNKQEQFHPAGEESSAGAVEEGRKSSPDIKEVEREADITAIKSEVPKSEYTPVDPVFLDVETDTEGKVCAVRVLLYTKARAQVFRCHREYILGSLLRYVEKFFPDRSKHNTLLVTPTIRCYSHLLSLVSQSDKVDQGLFRSYFSQWMDLYTLVHRNLFGPDFIKAGVTSANFLRDMAINTHPQSVETASLYTIRDIFDIQLKPLFCHEEKLKDSESEKGILRFHPDFLAQWELTSPPRISGCVIVSIHLNLLTLVTEGREHPCLASISITNSAEKTCFIPLQPSRRLRGKLDVASALACGFVCRQRDHGPTAEDHGAGDCLGWRDNGLSCVPESVGLERMVEILQEWSRGFPGLILVCGHHGPAWGVLFYALSRHRLLHQFKKIVLSIGTAEDIARKVGINPIIPFLGGYQEYYKQNIMSCSLSNARGPSLSSKLLECIKHIFSLHLGLEESLMNNLTSLHGPGIDYLLQGSGLLELMEDYQLACTQADMELLPGETKEVSVVLPHTHHFHVGKVFYIKTYGDVICTKNPSLLGGPKIVVTKLKNTSNQPIKLLKGEGIGLASYSNVFPFANLTGSGKESEATMNNMETGLNMSKEDCEHFSRNDSIGENKKAGNNYSSVTSPPKPPCIVELEVNTKENDRHPKLFTNPMNVFERKPLPGKHQLKDISHSDEFCTLPGNEGDDTLEENERDIEISDIQAKTTSFPPAKVSVDTILCQGSNKEESIESNTAAYNVNIIESVETVDEEERFSNSVIDYNKGLDSNPDDLEQREANDTYSIVEGEAVAEVILRENSEQKSDSEIVLENIDQLNADEEIENDIKNAMEYLDSVYVKKQGDNGITRKKDQKSVKNFSIPNTSEDSRNDAETVEKAVLDENVTASTEMNYIYNTGNCTYAPTDSVPTDVHRYADVGDKRSDVIDQVSEPTGGSTDGSHSPTSPLPQTEDLGVPVDDGNVENDSTNEPTNFDLDCELYRSSTSVDLDNSGSNDFLPNIDESIRSPPSASSCLSVSADPVHEPEASEHIAKISKSTRKTETNRNLLVHKRAARSLVAKLPFKRSAIPGPIKPGDDSVSEESTDSSSEHQLSCKQSRIVSPQRTDISITTHERVLSDTEVVLTTERSPICCESLPLEMQNYTVPVLKDGQTECCTILRDENNLPRLVVTRRKVFTMRNNSPNTVKEPIVPKMRECYVKLVNLQLTPKDLNKAKRLLAAKLPKKREGRNRSVNRKQNSKCLQSKQLSNSEKPNNQPVSVGKLPSAIKLKGKVGSSTRMRHYDIESSSPETPLHRRRRVRPVPEKASKTDLNTGLNPQDCQKRRQPATKSRDPVPILPDPDPSEPPKNPCRRRRIKEAFIVSKPVRDHWVTSEDEWLQKPAATLPSLLVNPEKPILDQLRNWPRTVHYDLDCVDYTRYFDTLLMYPGLMGLCSSFLLMYQTDVDKISITVTRSVTNFLLDLGSLGITGLEQLEEIVAGLHRRLPGGNFKAWRRGLLQAFKKITPSYQISPSDLDLAVKLVIYHCVDKLDI